MENYSGVDSHHWVEEGVGEDMAKDRREPIGDGPGFSQASASSSSRAIPAARASRKRERSALRTNKPLYEQPPFQGAPLRDDAQALAPLHPNFCAPEPDGAGTTDDDLPVRPLSRDVWVTKDGRELTIKEMYRPHLGNAQAVLSVWLKREKDPVKRRELKRWRSKMRRELVKREKAWQAKRKRQQANEG